jgi:hypothetical protein
MGSDGVRGGRRVKAKGARGRGRAWIDDGDVGGGGARVMRGRERQLRRITCNQSTRPFPLCLGPAQGEGAMGGAGVARRRGWTGVALPC